MQALLQSWYLTRRAIAGNDDLLLSVIESVERVEELLLRALFAGHKLDIVHQQDVDRSILVAERRCLIEADRIDQLIHEAFARDICDTHVRRSLLYRVPDRVHKMRLTEAHAAVYEQRVVGHCPALRPLPWQRHARTGCTIPRQTSQMRISD